MRILLPKAGPVVALLLLAPSIPELLTGSTPIAVLFFDPLLFALQFLGIMALYGGGALLIREFAVYFRKGWATILLLGAAYGIAEEGLAVHTFFETSGPPVNAFATYGHAFGVNWLWALGLTVFHATYSIALPILLVGLVYPDVQDARWLDRGAVGLTAVAYAAIVVLFSVATRYGPPPILTGFFLVVIALLIAVAWWIPRDALRITRKTLGVRPLALGLAASLPFDAWTGLLIVAGHPVIPAAGAAAFVLAVNALSVVLITRWTGTDALDWSKLYIASGMLGALFALDVAVAFSDPFILVVVGSFVVFLYLVRARLIQRDRAGRASPVGTPA